MVNRIAEHSLSISRNLSQDANERPGETLIAVPKCPRGARWMARGRETNMETAAAAHGANERFGLRLVISAVA